jgi:Raf kinase inhibitor-like YbhB/YbcL family protein
MAGRPPLPHEFLPEVPFFTVTSDDVTHGEQMSNAHVFNDWGFTGENLSPHLSWAGFPSETKSFAVTCYDPDAPTGSGFWHWVLYDLPASVTELATGAGGGDFKELPEGAKHGRNDYGNKEFGGAAPPPGTPHRYVFTVHALDVEELGVPDEASPAVVGFNITAHTLARAQFAPEYGH